MDSTSSIFMGFTLNERRRYTFTSTLTASGEGRAQVIFDGPSVAFVMFGNSNGMRSGVLTPGTYRFLADAGSGRDGIGLTGFGNGAFNFDFALMPAGATPEPASLVLLGTGLVGAALSRWRKRRSASQWTSSTLGVSTLHAGTRASPDLNPDI